MAAFVGLLKRYGEKIAFYLILWTGCLLGAAMIWYKCITGNWYYSHENSTLMDFFPPFLRDIEADYYIESPAEVWALWGCYVAGIFCLPAIIMIAFDLLNSFFLKRAALRTGDTQGGADRWRRP